MQIWIFWLALGFCCLLLVWRTMAVYRSAMSQIAEEDKELAEDIAEEWT